MRAIHISASSPYLKLKHRTKKTHETVQFAAEQQALEYYQSYGRIFAAAGCEFANKVKKKEDHGRWPAEWTEEELDSMSKPLREFDAAHKEIKTARIGQRGPRQPMIKLEITMRVRNLQKAVRKAAIQLTWLEARAQRLEVHTKHATYARLTSDWGNITAQPRTKPSPPSPPGKI